MAVKQRQSKRAKKTSGGSSTKPLIDFAFVTAIEIEREAVCAAFKLTHRHRVRVGTRVYWRGRLPLKSNEFYEIVVAQSPEMAQVEAAILTNDTIHDWDPGALLLVGVAGAASDGSREDDEALGDLVLGQYIHYHERGKVTPDGVKPEPITYKADATLWNNVITLPPMRVRIPVSRPDGKQTRPTILKGVIASGERVIAEAAVRDEIAARHRKTLAIEMEGYGFSAAVWQSADKRHHLVMKAICDRADRDKKQDWQPYAAAVAAQYAKHFLKDRPLEPRNKLAGKRESSDDVGGLLRRQQGLEREQQRAKDQIARMEAMLEELTLQQPTEDVQPRTTSFEEPQSDLSLQPQPAQAPDVQSGSAGSDSSINGLLTALSGALSREKAKEIEQIRELSREGKVRDALKRIREMREEQSWEYLEAGVQAKALRVEAGMVLTVENDIPRARQLVQDAKVLDPSGDDVIIRTLLSLYEEDASRALAELGEPTTTDAFNLKLSLLIYENRSEEILSLARNPPDGIETDIETRRMTALALLMVGDALGARSKIQTVLAERPKWESARALAAVIDYFSCLSPAALPKGYAPWPQPLDLSFTKVDPESLERLKQAEEQFAILAAETQRGNKERKLNEVWRLACIASAPSRQDEAADYCRVLLQDDVANHRALMWAVVLDYDVDLVASERALRELVETGRGEDDPLQLEKIIALVAVELKLRKTLEAAGLLARSKELFISSGIAGSWTFWYGQTCVIHGEPEKALEEADREPDPPTRRRIRLMALRELGYRNGDWQPLTEHLSRSFEETRDGTYLLELCRLKFFLKDWGYVADRGKTLVELVGTADVVRLAVAAAWNAQQPKRCLAILDDNEGVFPEKHLPGDLWRLRSRCEVMAGQLGRAVKTAEALVAADNATENIINLLDIQRQTGDLKGLAVTARILLEREDVGSRSLVRAARLVLLEHKELSRNLWRRAKADALDDPNLLREVLSLGNALGYDAQDPEVKPLVDRMEEFIAEGKGPGQVLQGERLRVWQEDSIRQRSEIAEKYYKGWMPAHYFAPAHQLQLAELLHRIPEDNRHDPSPRQQPAVFIRHGGHSIGEGSAKESASWRLHLDVTALLVADDLGVLEAVERCFAPLRISTLLQTALIAQRESLVQPLAGQEWVTKALVPLLDNGKAHLLQVDPNLPEIPPGVADQLGKELLSVLLKARAENGFVITNLPFDISKVTQGLVELLGELNDRVVGYEVVIRSLRFNGLLPEVDYYKAIRSLDVKAEDVDAQDALLPRGSKLFLVGSAAGRLAKAELLGLVCEQFKVFVDSDYAKAAHAQAEINQRRAETEAWVAELSERVRAGLTSGLYEGIDASNVNSEDDSDEEEQAEGNWDFAAGSHMLRYECQKGDVLCFDDRAVNAYGHRDNIAPIIGISEILLALLTRGELTEQQYYDKLIRLRASNYRYVPLDSKELLYHLTRATVTPEGEVAETFELAVLRKYLAACLLDGAYLQKPPLPAGAPNSTGELKFISDSTRAVTQALVGVWADESVPVEEARVRSEWILRNLYTGLFGVMHLLPNPERRGDGVEHIGLDIGSIFVYGQSIHGGTLQPIGYERRRQFFEWLDLRLVRPRRVAEPEAISAAAASISTTFSDTFERIEENPDLDLISRVIKYQFYVDLPESLQESLKLKPELMAWLGFELANVITMDAVQFDASDFWNAAAEAVNGRQGVARARKETLEDADEDYTFSAEVRDDSRMVLLISGPKLDKPYPNADPLLGILKDGEVQREAVLRRYRFWFDFDNSVFEKEVKEISSLADPRARHEKAYNLRENSAGYFYWSLWNHFRATGRVPESGLMPATGDSLLKHFSLPTSFDTSVDVPGTLSTAAEVLIINQGLHTSLTRFQCLPIRMPQSLVKHFGELNAEEKKDLLARFKTEWQSPVGKLHYVDLVLRSSAEDTSAIESAKSVFDELFDDERGAANFKAFEHILYYVNAEFGHPTNAADIPAGVRLLLVWAHACRLHDLFIGVGAPPDGLTKMFRGMPTRTSADALFREPDYWNNCLHPRMFSRIVFLTHGVASVLGENEQQVLERLKVRESLDEFLSAGDKETKILSLISDPALMTNTTGSFLGGDRAEVLSKIFESKDVQGLASSHLEESVRAAIGELKRNPHYALQWATIKAVVWDTPIYSDLRPDLQLVLKNLDLRPLIASDPTAATQALIVACGQFPYYPDDEIRSRLESAWLDLAWHYSTEFENGGVDEDRAHNTVAILLECALGLAVEFHNPRATSRAWGALLMRMLNVAPNLSRYLGYAIHKRVLETPATQLHGIFPVLLMVRALNKEPL